MKFKEMLLAWLAAAVVFGVGLYLTDKPNSAQFWGDFRLDRRYMGKPCDAWVGRHTPVDMNELDEMIGLANPGDTIIVKSDGTLNWKEGIWSE